MRYHVWLRIVSRHDAQSTAAQFVFFIILCVCLLFLATGCGSAPSAEDLRSVTFVPSSGGDWPVSTPEAEGLDPLLVARLYYNAAALETLYGVLVIKNDKLVAVDAEARIVGHEGAGRHHALHDGMTPLLYLDGTI